jgi:GNAT superfamily N-acetyltransferase
MVAGDTAATALIRKSALESLDGPPRDPWVPRKQDVSLHLLRTDPDCSWVAEINGIVVGYAQGFVRGDIWSLAQLFVLPEVHASGVGTQLLRRARASGEERGARTFYVLASTSPAAQAIYMREGMFATAIGYRVSGPVEALRALPEPAGNRKRVVDCSGWQDRIAELDREVWGAERRDDHGALLAGYAAYSDHASFALTEDGRLVGYGYAMDDGYFGPVAAITPEDQLPLLRMAGDWLADHEIGPAWSYVLSTNTVVLGTLLRAGWQATPTSFLMCSRPFGQLDRYVPSGGVLL